MATIPASAPKIVFGAAAIGNREPYITDEGIEALFSMLDKHHVKVLDSAQLYGKSEEALGKVKAGERFTIDTKWLGGWTPGSATEEKVIETAHKSIETLGTKKVDIFYLHAPDTSTPFSQTLAGINKAHQSGLFTRFGVSNFTPAQVREVHSICSKNNYVLPTVYQGNYSAVARRPDTDLFPLLRELGIAFYAYSPIAGGFLGKTRKQLEEGQGRFNDESLGGMYKGMYMKESYLHALEKWGELADEQGCKKAELAYRWVEYHSPLKGDKGDALIIGASSLEQVDETMKGLERGPLKESVAKGIDEIWKMIEKDAPVDNYEWSQKGK